jgi:predicted nucleic acid-binding protein
MMRLQIYIDTSVIGGCLDKEFQNASRQLIDKFKQGEMTVVISELTTLELKNAPQEVRDIVGEIAEKNIRNKESFGGDNL